MSTAQAPIKVDPETDRLATQAAHFLNTTKKDVVDRAIREYIDNHRSEIAQGVKDALKELDGSGAAAVRLMTGLTDEQIARLGGVPE